MKTTITIALDNAAFKPSQGAEVARILRNIANKFEGDDALLEGLDVTLYDVNGNRVGDVVVSRA